MEVAREWRCRKCRTLLGIGRGDRLYLRLRKFQFVIFGESTPVIATCGVCSLTDERPSEFSLESEPAR